MKVYCSDIFFSFKEKSNASKALFGIFVIIALFVLFTIIIN